MDGQIFSCRRGNEQCENSWAKSGGLEASHVVQKVGRGSGQVGQ